MRTGALIERGLSGKVTTASATTTTRIHDELHYTLVEANGLQSINELGVLAGRMTFSNLKSLDYPAPAYPGLAQITGHPEERWFDMTFFHLIQRFGCAMN